MWSPSHTTEPLLSPDGNVALGSWVQPFVWENIPWPLSHRHILRSPWTPGSIVTHQPEKHSQLSPLGTSPESQQIEPALFLSCNGNARWALQAPMWRVLLSNLSIWGTHEPFNGIPILSQKDTFCFGAAHTPHVGEPPCPLEQTLHSSAIMDTNSCLRVHVTHALTQVLVISNQPQHIGTALCSTMY